MERRKIAQDVLKAVSRIKGRQASSRAMRTRESYVTWCCQLGSNSETTHGNTECILELETPASTPAIDSGGNFRSPK